MSNLPVNQANNPVNNPNPNPNPVNPPNLPNPLTVTARATVARTAVAPRQGGLDTISTVDRGLEGIPMMPILWHLQLMDAIDP